MKEKYDYSSLWKLLIDLGMSKTDLRVKANLTTVSLARMGKGEPISLNSLNKICSTLNCTLDQIIKINNFRKGDNADEE